MRNCGDAIEREMMKSNKYSNLMDELLYLFREKNREIVMRNREIEIYSDLRLRGFFNAAMDAIFFPMRI